MEFDRKTHLELAKECDYIVAKALAGENTIVMIGPLMFIAYDGGDAFVLDLEDKYACQICADGKKQHYPLFETETKWIFNWPWRYFLAEGDVWFEKCNGGDSSGLPSMIAGGLKRMLARYNRKAGTSYQL